MSTQKMSEKFTLFSLPLSLCCFLLFLTLPFFLFPFSLSLSLPLCLFFLYATQSLRLSPSLSLHLILTERSSAREEERGRRRRMRFHLITHISLVHETFHCIHHSFNRMRYASSLLTSPLSSLSLSLPFSPLRLSSYLVDWWLS
jgi:hypothetical protein